MTSERSANDSGRNLPAVLVTGAAGMIGAHLVRSLMAMNRVRVVALDDLSGGFLRNLPEGVAFVRGSVCDASLLANLFAQHDFRVVYHLAAYAAEGLSHHIRRFNYTNNVIGSVNLINECVRHGTDCMVFASSIAVYGALTPPMTEEQVPRPIDPYGIAKWTVELDLAAAREHFGLRYVIFRPHNVYGEYQNLGDPYRNVIGIFMNQIMQGRPLTIFGDGTQRRAFSYVLDVASIIAESPWIDAAHGQVFNVGADEVVTVGELARLVSSAMGVSGHPLEYLPPRNEVQVAYSDHAKARRVFGERSDVGLEDGLARMATWARQIGAQLPTSLGAVEVRQNLPPSWLPYLSATVGSSEADA